MNMRQTSEKLLLVIFVLLLFGSLIGCTPKYFNDSKKRGTKIEFDEVECGSYVVLGQTSKEYIDLVAAEHEWIIQEVLKTWERFKDDPEHLKHWLDEYKAFDWREAFSESVGGGEHLDRMNEGDRLYYFKYEYIDSRFAYNDYGFLILRNGDIVFRKRFGYTASRKPEFRDVELPFPKIIDKMSTRDGTEGD